MLLPVESLQAEERHDSYSENKFACLTVEEVAEALDRSLSTVRGWCASGQIGGVFKLGGREWRIPQTGLRKFIDQQAETHKPPSPPLSRRRRADLGSWRRLQTDSKGEGNGCQ